MYQMILYFIFLLYFLFVPECTFYVSNDTFFFVLCQMSLFMYPNIFFNMFLFLYQRVHFIYQMILIFLGYILCIKWHFFIFLFCQMALFMYPKILSNMFFIFVAEGTFYVSNDTLFLFFIVQMALFTYSKILCLNSIEWVEISPRDQYQRNWSCEQKSGKKHL